MRVESKKRADEAASVKRHVDALKEEACGLCVTHLHSLRSLMTNDLQSVPPLGVTA